MTDLNEWLARAHAAWPGLDAVADGTAGLRNAILGLWSLMAEAPPNIRDLYRGLDEATLVTQADAAARSDGFPPLPWPCTTPETRDGFWRVMAVTLRALEIRLAALSDGGTIRRGEQCRATYGAVDAYIVSLRPRHRVPATGHSFRRRGLVGLRVLPLALPEFRMRVRFVEDPVDRPDPVDGLLMGAALFTDFEFDIEDTVGGFLIRGATSPDHLGGIERAVRRADGDGCLSLMLPELTVDSGTLQSIQDRLANGAWEVEQLCILVAGSRHVDLGAGCVNVTTVLDRYGAEVAAHAKLFRYNEGEGPHEDIVLGDTLEVLVTPDAVLAFGICLDFCNTAEPSPYPWLDVDYVLVPSCGGLSTMRGHVDRSSELLRTMRTRSLVVQQHYGPHPTESPPLGYVLARAGGNAPSAEELATSDTWMLVRL